MRIMHVASKDLPIPPIRGGAIQLWIHKVSQILASQEGTRIAVVSPWDSRLPERETLGDVEHWRIRFSRAYVRVFCKWLGIDPWGYPWRVAKAAAAWKADIVHLHGGGSLWLPFLRKRMPHVPLVIHLHNDPRQELHKWPWRDWTNVNFLACSRYIANVAREGLGIPDHRISVIPNGVDISDFTPRWLDSSSGTARRKSLEIPDEALVLLFCGRVAPEKGPHLLAAAAAPLMKENPHLWCVFAGDYHKELVPGKPEWHETYASIRDALIDVWSRVRFTGPLPSMEMPSIFSAGDVFVGPAQWEEPFGMVYVEAMAAGLPVVACPRGGIPEFVDDTVGRLVRDKAELANCLGELLASASLRSILASAARQRALESYSWETVARELSAAYRNMAPEEGGARQIRGTPQG